MRYSISDYSRTAASKGWGRGWPTCDAQKRVAKVTAPISGVTVVVNARIARLVYLLLAETERRGYLLVAGQCWGGNCRAIAGTQTPSNHSWWLAVDLNSLANPYVVKKFGRPVTDMPAWLPLLWNAFGFAWGGDYSGAKADAMHLEFMGSPEDADDMTALAEQRLTTGGLGVITLPPSTSEENELDADQNNRLTGAWLRSDAAASAAADAARLAQETVNWIVDPNHGVLKQIGNLAATIATARDDVDEQTLATAVIAGLAPQVTAALADAGSGLTADQVRQVTTEVVRGAFAAAAAG